MNHNRFTRLNKFLRRLLNMGPGSVYWDCQYNSVEECTPNVLAGNRGFCNPNPRYRGPEQLGEGSRRGVTRTKTH